MRQLEGFGEEFVVRLRRLVGVESGLLDRDLL